MPLTTVTDFVYAVPVGDPSQKKKETGNRKMSYICYETTTCTEFDDKTKAPHHNGPPSNATFTNS